MIIYLLGAFWVSLICGLVFTPLILDFCKRKRLYDIPNERKVHKIATACLLPFAGLYINNLYGMFGIHEIPYWLGVPLTVFIIVFIDNAINLIDGIDGLAASLSFLALSGFLAYFVYNDVFVYTYTIIVAGMMGALVAFAYFNLFGKAERNTKIFIGDMAFVGPRPERKYYIDRLWLATAVTSNCICCVLVSPVMLR
jgi:UDP-N-acetylmuramyl pentapeptide phosphotransferase/UDP-N-acetylglucosamine-1-phosphate transferase